MIRLTPNRSKSPLRGFTLIEIMIVVAILGILGAIAINSYTSQIAKSRRTTAKSALTENAQLLERFYNQNFKYIGFTPNSRVPAAPSETQLYTLSFTSPATNGCTPNPGASCWQLVATRLSSGPQKNDVCGDFVLDHTGARSIINSTGQNVETCWR